MSADELEERRVARALDALAADDPDAAEYARSALDWITGGEGLDPLDQHRLQQFLWYALPRKWLTGADVHREVADALGALLDRLGYERYAAICRSDTTHDILLAWEEDDDAGFDAFAEATDASGVDPPDTPELAWGEIMGMVEATAQDAAARVLEDAIVDGEFEPGTTGWRSARVEVTRRFLRSEHPVEGRPWLEVVRDERRGRWLAARGALAEIRREVVGLLEAAADVPADAEEALAPLTYLLEEAADGIELTGTHRLRPPFVEHLEDRFGWDAPGTRRLEDDVPEVWRLREYTEDLGLLRRRKRELLLTSRGRRLLADPAARWRAAAAGLAEGEGFSAAVREVILAVLLTADEPVAFDDLVDRAHEATSEAGWRDGSPTGLERAQARRQAWNVAPLLKLFALLEVTGRHYQEVERWALTSAGRAAAVEALRARATAPMSRPAG